MYTSISNVTYECYVFNLNHYFITMMIFKCDSCNMGTSDLLDMYAKSPRVVDPGLRAYISGKIMSAHVTTNTYVTGPVKINHVSTNYM